MDITLVTSSYDKVVHGTDNDKKTGCGINLLKPENVTRFHRTSRMTDLKEITCEKCKASLAKKLIKADKKEMALLLKEEKKREKLGYGDEGIVPLGNTTARITKDPDARRKEEEARKKAAEEARAAAEAKRKADEEAANEAIEYYSRPAENAAPEPAAPVNNIPGTGIPMDDSLAQFAIDVPREEENAPAASEEDDFLAQFAIQKPDAQAAPVQNNVTVTEDDFLAQFAIPTPQQSAIPGGEPAPVNYGTEPEEMDGLDFNYNSQPVQPAPVYVQPEQAAQVQGEEDVMQMFSIDNNVQEPVYGQNQYGQPVYEQPVYGGDQPVYYTEDGQIVQPYIPQDQQYIQPDGQYIQPDMIYPAEPLQGAEMYDPNQMYGYDETIQQGVPVSAPVYPQYNENMPKEMDELDIPAIGDISAPIPEAIPSVPDIGAPVLDDISGVEDIQAPVIDDISMAQEAADAVSDGIPTVEDIAVPAFDEIPKADHTAAPIIDDISAPADLTAPIFEDMPVLGDADETVIENISAQTFNEPVMAEEEYDNIMSDYNYVAPGAGANTNEAEQPKQQAQQPQQIIKVPQLAGYDANNQPVYKYVQMKLVGRDQNGQPVYVPVGAQPQQRPAGQQAAPAQQTAAQAQRAAAAPVQQAQAQRPAAPVQQAQVKSPVPRKPVQQSGIPSANISKIAVNPHSKSTSQAFINAIASSKDYADKNLIETQGLKANSPVLTSVEDVLSTMGDESAKRQMQAKAQAQQNVPVFDEYKAPQKTSYRGGNSAPRQQSSSMNDALYMTKAELKAKKKQDKIDAKFRKEMSKRGF
ncbi:hypothetical protein SAMN02910265_01339 [Ruminococcus flavefaciens]|uniref:Uncharacterized protein n=1 Tax=Ruminococcus flavefaciens TaxID=1265 RepID=A0A1H6J7C0_RUMFL|nr:hypothetical protein [Ruminococcus flavefaciens]SEH54722.1 hypothetical protein SAMN02910265_01339 [Ruminococcus flavefaciens]